MRRIWLVAWFLLALVSCRKDERSSPVAAMLPKDVAARLPADLLVIAEALPATTQAFGYFDLGGPLTPLPAAWADYRMAVDDLLEMAKRRWHVDLRQARGYGMVAVGSTFALVAAIPPPKGAPPKIEDGWTFGRLGALTTFGPSDAVAAVTAAAAQQKPFYVEHAAWLKAVLTHAAGARMMGAAVWTPELRRELPASVAPQLATLELATFAIGKDRAAIYLDCKPQGAASVRALVDTGVGFATQALTSQLAALPSDGPGPLAKALVQPLAQALLKSLRVTTKGDTVALELPWHAPKLLAASGATAITDRVIAPGEWAVVQVDLQRPAIEALVSVLDVLSEPLDKAAMSAQLKAELAALLGAPAMDPRGFIVSAGSDLVAVSVQGKAGGAAAAAPAQLGGLPAVTTSWGMAVTTKDGGPALQLAAAQPGQPLAGPATSKLLAQEGSVFAAVDLSIAPPRFRQDFADAPVRAAELAVIGTRFHADVTAEPGKAGQLVAELKRLIATTKAQADPPYRDRANGPAFLELMAIMQHQQAELLAELATPKAISGDRLHFERDFPLVREPMIMAAMASGVLAAIAIPAYLDFMKKAKVSEAVLELNMLRTQAKAAQLADGGFVVGSAGPTPAQSCCSFPNRKCPDDQGAWNDPIWSGLDFRVDGPQNFRYQYRATATELLATAIGDLDCDGTEIQYQLHGTIENGAAHFELTQPDPSAD
jgi:type II secretory pathway pseudopilin PulG